MKQKRTLGIFALAVVAVLGVSMVSAFGFGNGIMNHDFAEKNKTQMQEQMTAMKTAIENEDYETWKSLMQVQIAKMQEQITQENFNEIVARNQEMQEMKKSCDEDEDCQMNKEGFEHQGHFKTPIEKSSE